MNLPTQSPENTRGPIRCLVVQLARLGDTLQSLMALRAAKQLYPHLEIHFLARDRFAAAAKRIPWIEKVITFPTDTILGPILTGDKTETQTLGDLARWIAPLVKDPWDLVVNWTFSESSSYLTALIPARVKLGYTRRRDSSFAGADGWSHFIQAIVQGKVHQNIHLTDVLTTQLLTALQIHEGEPKGDGNSAVTSKTFFNLQADAKSNLTPEQSAKKWISIQLGAGRESKTWDALSWTKLILYILQRNPDHGVYLLGGIEDESKEKIILAGISKEISNPTIISYVGKTGFDLWASIVGNSQWLFAGDTAAIHLASVLGVRVVNISVGPVRYFETGPYGNGHYVLTSSARCETCYIESGESLGEALVPSDAPESRKSVLPGEHTCGRDISPEAVYAVWNFASQEWTQNKTASLANHFEKLGWTDKLHSIRAFRSRIRNAADGGGVFYESMLKRPISIEDWTGMVMGHLARAWYCGWLPPVGQDLSRENISPSLIQKLREMDDSTQVLSKICQQASLTADSLKQKSSTLKSEKVMGVQDRADLQKLGKTLLELETLLERITKTHPALAGFSQMSKVLMHHLQGTHLADLGKETSESYKQINEGVQIFRQWIKSTLDLAKPVVVQATNVTRWKELST